MVSELMGREYYYKPGSFYRICDRTGFAVRAERTKKQWDGVIVRDISWERRQPQDFVKGVRDDQTVPEARPRAVPTYIGPLQSTLIESAVLGSQSIAVASPFTANVGDTLLVFLDFDLGTPFYCTVTGPATDGDGSFSSDMSPDFDIGSQVQVGISPALPGMASSGNPVTNLSAVEISPASYGASNGG